MLPQNRAPIKDVDLEPMSINLKEGGYSVINRGEDLTTVDFGSDVSLAEKEQTNLLEPMDDYVGAISVTNGGRSVVNRDEVLTAIDFDDHVSMAEKEGAGMAGRGGPTQGKHSRMDGA
ncbi:hypothetical protein BHE74_00043734 [Ensete ventricosum]|nr:hypothetical protein BHE74_00043734 [Ensete ventricosum]